MKKFYILLIALFIVNGAMTQSCLPDGIEFTTQAQIDSFQADYPNCTEIEGEMTISGSDITNLNGLNVLTSIGGDLRIDHSDALTTLMGLDNVTSVGGSFGIVYNDALTSLTGLEGITSIGGSISIIGNALTSLTGLDNLTSIGGNLKIYNSNTLTSLTGLENLTSIGDDLFISGNFSLSTCDAQWLCDYLANPTSSINIYHNATGCNSVIDLAIACGGVPCLPYGNYNFVSQADIDNFQLGFPNCTELEGDVIISGSDITNLNGLNVLMSIGGDLDIRSNSALTSLMGLNNLDSIGGDFYIWNNDTLTSLTGLEGLQYIEGALRIGWETRIGYYGNPFLSNLTGLNNVITIGGDLYISYNESLTSLTGLDNLTSIGGNLQIGAEFVGNPVGNPALTSLTGLDNLILIWGELTIIGNNALTSLTGLDNIIAFSISDLYISSNYYLSTCAVQSICDYLASPNGTIQILDNATGCNSQEEVDSACVYLSNGMAYELSSFSIYPNPSSNQITISTPTTPDKNTFLTIHNISGQQLLKRQIIEQKTVVDVSGLTAGIYLLKVTDERTVKVGKFVKQ